MSDLIVGIGELIVGGLFGNTLFASIFLFGFMAIMGLVMKFTLDCWIVCMPTAVFMMTYKTALLPDFIWPIFLACMGILIAIGVIRMWRRG